MLQQQQQQHQLSVQDAQNVSVKVSSSACDISKPGDVGKWAQQARQQHAQWNHMTASPPQIQAMNRTAELWGSMEAGSTAPVPQGVPSHSLLAPTDS